MQSGSRNFGHVMHYQGVGPRMLKQEGKREYCKPEIGRIRKQIEEVKTLYRFSNIKQDRFNDNSINCKYKLVPNERKNSLYFRHVTISTYEASTQHLLCGFFHTLGNGSIKPTTNNEFEFSTTFMICPMLQRILSRANP